MNKAEREAEKRGNVRGNREEWFSCSVDGANVHLCSKVSSGNSRLSDEINVSVRFPFEKASALYSRNVDLSNAIDQNFSSTNKAVVAFVYVHDAIC